MRKLTLIFIIIAMAVAAPLFAAGGKENTETAKVTIWHSAPGANATVFEEIAQTVNDTIGKDKGIEIEAIYQGKANDVLTRVNAAAGTGNVPDKDGKDAAADKEKNQ